VADTTQPRLVWEVPSYPTYYFPVEDVRTDLLVPTATVSHSPSRGDAQHFTIKAWLVSLGWRGTPPDDHSPPAAWATRSAAAWTIPAASAKRRRDHAEHATSPARSSRAWRNARKLLVTGGNHLRVPLPLLHD
jgi:uncharacterized protein (DUF427 family)